PHCSQEQQRPQRDSGLQSHSGLALRGRARLAVPFMHCGPAFSERRLSMTTRSWLGNLLTTVLARLTRRDTAGARPQVSWNGRPLGAAPEGALSPDSPAPDPDYGTLCLPVTPARPERTSCVEPPGGAGAGPVAS